MSTAQGQNHLKLLMASKHISIETWLTALGMKEYQSCFSGFTGVQELLQATEADVRDLGVRNGAHRARIISSLVLLREKIPGNTSTSNAALKPKLPGMSRLQRSQSSESSSLQQLQQHGYAAVGPPHTHSTTSGDGSKASSDLYKYPWYHGHITREAAEALTTSDGDFLLRDSASKPGDYVLTSCWKGNTLHFVVNKKKNSETGKTQYQFEEALFDRVAELVHFYVSKKKPISSSSGAVISAAVPRAHLYDNTHHQNHHNYHRSGSLPCTPHSAGHSPLMSPHGSPRPSPLVSPAASPPTGRRLPHSRSSTTNHPLLLSSDGEVSDSEMRTSPVHKMYARPNKGSKCQGSPNIAHKFSHHSSSSCSNPAALHHVYSDPVMVDHIGPSKPNRLGTRPPLPTRNPAMCEEEGMEYSSIDQVLVWPSASATDSSDDHDKTPTNPTPSVSIETCSVGLKQEKSKVVVRPRVAIRNRALYEDDGKDYSDYDQVKSWPAVIEARQRQEQREKEAAEAAAAAAAAAAMATEAPAGGRDGRKRKLTRKTGVAADAVHAALQQHSLSLDDSTVTYDCPKSPKPVVRSTERAASVDVLECEYDSPRSHTLLVSTNHSPPLNASSQHVTQAANHSSPLNASSQHVTQAANQNTAQTDDNRHPDQSDLIPTRLPAPLLSPICLPPENPTTCFDLHEFKSSILPSDNPPLDNRAMASVKSVLVQVCPYKMASHITYVDLQMLRLLGGGTADGGVDVVDLGVGVTSTLELITLPHGRRLRLDIIERFHTLKQFVALTILTFPKYLNRARMLSIWIAIALELLEQFRNLYAFSAIMAGLSIKQVCRLQNTWEALQEHYKTESDTYHRLKVICETLNCAAADTGSSNTTVTSAALQNPVIPHIIPQLELLEQQDSKNANVPPHTSSSNSSSTSSSGVHNDIQELEYMFASLQAARSYSSCATQYRQRAGDLIGDMLPGGEVDALTLEVCSTQLHLKLLWGSRDAKQACTNRHDRYYKFARVLTVLSDRVEPAIDATSSTTDGGGGGGRSGITLTTSGESTS